MKKHTIISVVSFILLVPFRLPISVLLIKFFTYIANMSGEALPHTVLASNVCVTKCFYTTIVSFALIMSLRSIIRHYTKGKIDVDFPTIPIAGVLMCYVIFDVISTDEIYWAINR